MKRLIGLCLMLLLGACNRVITDTPLFSAADSAGAPALRDGVWLIGESEGCRVDVRKPVNRWPDCASWMIVRDGALTGLDREKGKAPRWTSIPYVLAAGEPPVLQLAMLEEEVPGYWYFGFEATRTEADGRVSAFTIWPVQCGPPPPPPSGEGEPSYVTREPLPGMTIREQNCTTDQPGAVRAAAGASRAWEPDPDTARWVKARYP